MEVELVVWRLLRTAVDWVSPSKEALIRRWEIVPLLSKRCSWVRLICHPSFKAIINEGCVS